MRPAIEVHTQRGAAGWDSALWQLGSQCYSEGGAAVQAHHNATALRWVWEDEPGSLPLRRLPGYPVLQAEMRWGGGMPALAATTSTYVSCRMFPRCLLAGLSPPPPELLLIASATRLPPG